MSQPRRGNGCRSTEHCVTWGFCGKCDPKLASRVNKEWQGGSDREYAKLVLKTARELD